MALFSLSCGGIGVFLVGMVMNHRLFFAAGAGETATGVGQLFVGLAALVAAVTSWMNNRKIGKGIVEIQTGNTAAKVAAERAQEVAEVIGEKHPSSNGATLMELVHRVTEFEAYQHENNHKVLNTVAGVPLMVNLLERILDVLEHREPGKEGA